ncbi:hypothetical protein PENSPDRAFT_666145 [Peniophora sp. CONT]|nr:hypothetical protein PENSPDRAFT_666145 [Peniophora sp. CONT]
MANPPSHLVSLPSLSSHLSSLPQAGHMANVSMYTSPLAGQHAGASEAKLRKALSHNSGAAVNYPAPQSANGGQPIMMRAPTRLSPHPFILVLSRPRYRTLTRSPTATSSPYSLPLRRPLYITSPRVASPFRRWISVKLNISAVIGKTTLVDLA